MKIIDIHRRCKEKLDVLYVPLICAIGAFLWNTIFASHFQSIFYNGYLNRFGINASYPISGITAHSQIMSNIVMMIIFIIIVIANICLKYLLDFITSKYDKKYIVFASYLLAFILEIIFFILLFGAYMIYTLQLLNTNFSIPDIINAYINHMDLNSILSLASPACFTFFILLLIKGVIITPNEIQMLKNKILNVYFCFKLLIILLVFICSCIYSNNLVSDIGIYTAELEIAYPSFQEHNKTFIVIATINDDKYLAIDKDTIKINKKDIKENITTISLIVDIDNIILTEITNPLQYSHK